MHTIAFLQVPYKNSSLKLLELPYACTELDACIVKNDVQIVLFSYCSIF